MLKIKTSNIKVQLEELFAKHNIISVTCDSRRAGLGCAYFAISGSKHDGNDFIDDARAKGAKLIFSENSATKASQGLDDVILVDNIRYALSIAAGIVYPKLPPKLIAVTGTNGKTSVVSYCYSILAKLGIKAASIGTIGIETNCYGNDSVSKLQMDTGGLTTADPVAFRKNLHDLAEAGVEVVAFEASSHGVQQDRLGDVKVDAAAFVSFSQDHLDYHGSMENYLEAKLKLFKEHLKPGASAILPIDINSRQEIISFFERHNISYNLIDNSFGSIGLESRVSVKIHSINSSISGQEIEFSYPKNAKKSSEKSKLNIRMIGSFQANNIILAIELLRLTGFDNQKLIDTASYVEGVTGRLQRISKTSDDWHVFVDYAHTPDALEKSLIELKKLKHSDARLIVVFGCGGDRDKSKRPIMGGIAEDVADIIIVTDDNPRYEDAATIRQEIIAGMKEQGALQLGRRLHEIAGRGQAIESAIKIMKKGDIALIAGKGHEEYQIIKGNTLKFSDISTVRDILTGMAQG